MAPADPKAATLLQALQAEGGLASSPKLQARLGWSQASVSRALAPWVREGVVRKVGAARSQRYLLPRALPGLGASSPVHRIDEQGVPHRFGELTALPGGRFWMDEVDGTARVHDGLPWFLSDMRPQGFMGRAFARHHPELGLPTDPRQWTDDEVLRALALAGEDLPGNLIVGEAAFQRYAQALLPTAVPTQVHDADQPDELARAAAESLQGQWAGSSAGGEQPKFCALSQGLPVIVKFSAAGDGPAEQRSRDLLVCEHLALRNLADAGVATAPSRLAWAAGRVFLISQRFDRTRRGRIGMVSLMAFDAEHIGHMDHWAATAQRLRSRELISAADAETLCLLDAYGLLIANTDRHYGNISWLRQDGAWRLSPGYDMLPMYYAAVNGEVVARDLAALPLHPVAATLAVWPQALALALRFWQQAAQADELSEDFRRIAAANVATLQALG